MSSIISGPVALFQDALRTVDKQLENVSLAADALQRGRGPLPPITSDFNEDERQSFISKAIGAIRDQVQRGLPIASLPPDTLVRAPIFYQTVSADDVMMIRRLHIACLARCLCGVQEMGRRYR